MQPSLEHSRLHCLPLNFFRIPLGVQTTSPFLYFCWAAVRGVRARAAGAAPFSSEATLLLRLPPWLPSWHGEGCSPGRPGPAKAGDLGGGDRSWGGSGSRAGVPRAGGCFSSPSSQAPRLPPKLILETSAREAAGAEAGAGRHLPSPLGQARDASALRKSVNPSSLSALSSDPLGVQGGGRDFRRGLGNCKSLRRQWDSGFLYKWSQTPFALGQ